MSSYECSKVLPTDIHRVTHVLDNLRASDVTEIEELSGDYFLTLYETLASCMDVDNPTYLVYKTSGGPPVALFGLKPSWGNSSAVVWLLATDKLEANVSLQKNVKTYLKAWYMFYPVLWNVASTKNTKTLKWLDRLGFDLEDLGNGMTRFVYNPKET
jgi:hypothetical protein